MVRFPFVPLALAAIATVGAPAFADDKTPAEKKEKMVCKEQPRTNSRFTQRVCRSPEQWRQITDENKKVAHEIIDRPSINPPGD